MIKLFVPGICAPRNNYLFAVPAECTKRQFYENIKWPEGVHNIHAIQMIVTAELVQNMSFLKLNMGSMRVTILAHTPYFTLLTTCTSVVQS